MLSLVSLALFGMAQTVMSYHPRAADPWVTSTKASCSSRQIEIIGYGGGRPLDQKATVSINGRSVTGSDVTRLIDDLSHKRAVYRLQLLCDKNASIILHVSWGERSERGEINFWSSTAYFSGYEVKKYWAPEVTNTESFWFR